MRHIVVATLIVLATLSACSKSTNDQKVEMVAVDPKPTIVPVTTEQVAVECERLGDSQINGPQKGQMIEDMIIQAFARYGHKPLTIVIAGTDSVSGGLDNWRTCANFGPRQLGLSDDAIAIFYDQNDVSCEESPNGYVSQIVVIGPEGFEKTIVSPIYKTERMIIMVAIISVGEE